MAPRIGHGPFRGFSSFLTRRLFYDSRPDVKVKTRPPEWAKLQSEWRFLQALFCYWGPPSHILWNIKWPFSAIMLVSVGVHLYHMAAIRWNLYIPDEHGILQEGFRMTSFAMSLLLAFRLNRTYERWKEARISFSGVGTGATSVFLQAATWIKDPKLLDDFRRFCIVWPYSIKQVVTSAKTLDPIALALLHPEELEIYSGSRKGRQVVFTKMQQLALDAQLPVDQFISMQAVLQTTWKSAGDALRVKFQAMPQGVSLVCTGFVEIWCLLLPFGISTDTVDTDWITLVAVAVISLLLLAVDEVANQMEDPFQVMPVDDIVSTYERDINRVLRESAELRQAARVIDARAPKGGVAELPSAQRGYGGGGGSGGSGDPRLDSAAEQSIPLLVLQP